MKKTAAILLLCLMVFNTTGYRLMVQWMQQQQSRQLDKQLDTADYEETSLIEVIIPLSLPYYNNWSDWERYEGSVQLNGQTYQYVKRKIEGGNLILKCLPNPQQQIIQKEIGNAFARLNGLSVTEKGTSKSVKQPVNAHSFEYEELMQFHLQNIAGLLNQKPAFPPSGLLTAIFLHAPWQPPESIS